MPKKIRLRDIVSKEILNIIFLFFLIFMNIGSAIFFEQNSFKSGTKDEEIVIEDNLNLSQVANVLERKGIIGNRYTFILVGKLLGFEKKIKTGIFKISYGLSNYDLFQKFIELKETKTKTVTFIEGLTLKKIASIASDNFAFSSKEFLAICSDSSLLKSYNINKKSMEGFLMPDTYNFFVNSKPIDIIKKMANEFDKFYKKNIAGYEKTLKMTKSEIVTIASIVEGETNVKEEKFMISGVYHNRLKKRMKLEACPTVKYLIGDRKKLFARDYKIKSPYNTYLNFGLPPGPINNPGRFSLLAAVQPVSHNYLFFVVAGDKPGHNFSENFAQHQIAVRHYRNWEKKK